MIPAPSYEHIEKVLNQKNFQLERGFAEGVPKNIGTVGFIIFDQNYERELLQDLIRNLDLLNENSGSHIHFFLCGVSKFGPNNNSARELGILNGTPLYHNAKASYSFINAFKSNIPNWDYEFGIDLLLIDVKYNDKIRLLDFDSVVFFKIEELITNKIINKPSELLGKIVKFARDGKLKNATAFKDELKRVFGINWVKGLILAMFPKSIAQLARAEAALGGGKSLPE